MFTTHPISINPVLADLASTGQSVLLVNAPAVDVRLPWVRWRQPVGLLRIGAALRSQGCDVRLIDCLQPPSGGRLTRTRVSRLDVEGQTVDVWCFGLPPRHVAAQMRAWEAEGWRPKRILVSCGDSTWWSGARDLIAYLKQHGWAEPHVILGGPYPTSYPDHAAEHTLADTIVAGDVPGALEFNPDLGLYQPGSTPRFAALFLRMPGGCNPQHGPARPGGQIADELARKAALGVTTFAFYDNWLGPADRDALASALEAVIRVKPRQVGFVALGNLSPRAVDVELARLLKRAGFRHVFLHDDIQQGPKGVERLSVEADYARCAEAMHADGFRARTDELCACVLAGIPGEDIANLTRYLVRLASIIGSVNLVPFQSVPDAPNAPHHQRWVDRANGHADPASLNGFLYPLARRAGATFEDYVELARLAALLNSKYHNRTFDFMGNNLAAELFRNSLSQELWKPFVDARPVIDPIPLEPSRKAVSR